MIETTPLMWIGFLTLVLGVLAIDLFLVDRKAHRVPLKEALLWSALWIGLAAAFGIGLALWSKAGPAVASKFAGGYI
jgi:tellurite resistance protein TerC